RTATGCASAPSRGGDDQLRDPFGSALIRDEHPEGDVDDLAHPEQAEQHEEEADQEGGDAEPRGQGRADAGDELAVAGTHQCRTHPPTVPREPARGDVENGGPDPSSGW